MLISRPDPFKKGAMNTREIDITPEQLSAYESGALIQNVMSHISESDREFLMTGMSDEDWDRIFGQDDADSVTQYVSPDAQ